MTCASCREPLRLALFPSEGAAAWCQSCTQPADYGDLVRSGIPSGLIVRLMEWEREFPRLTGIGVGGDYGPGLDDPSYARAWRALFTESKSLLADVGWHVPVQSRAITEVFGSGSPDDATDEAIARWRRRTRRMELVDSYGWLFGMKQRDPAGTPAEPPAGILRSDEEAIRFRSAVELAGRSDTPTGLSEGTWQALISDLERELSEAP